MTTALALLVSRMRSTRRRPSIPAAALAPIAFSGLAAACSSLQAHGHDLVNLGSEGFRRTEALSGAVLADRARAHRDPAAIPVGSLVSGHWGRRARKRSPWALLQVVRDGRGDRDRPLCYHHPDSTGMV